MLFTFVNPELVFLVNSPSSYDVKWFRSNKCIAFRLSSFMEHSTQWTLIMCKPIIMCNNWGVVDGHTLLWDYPYHLVKNSSFIIPWFFICSKYILSAHNPDGTTWYETTWVGMNDCQPGGTCRLDPYFCVTCPSPLNFRFLSVPATSAGLSWQASHHITTTHSEWAVRWMILLTLIPGVTTRLISLWKLSLPVSW